MNYHLDYPWTLDYLNLSKKTRPGFGILGRKGSIFLTIFLRQDESLSRHQSKEKSTKMTFSEVLAEALQHISIHSLVINLGG